MSDVRSGPDGQELLQSEVMKSIRAARITILVLSILHLFAGAGIFGLAAWVAAGAVPKAQAAAAAERKPGEKQPEVERPEAVKPGEPNRNVRKAVGEVQFLALLTFATGLGFIVLYFWARTNPFGATSTALAIWCLGQLADLRAVPGSLQQGLLVKVIILLALAQGVLAGWRYRKLVRGGEPVEHGAS